MKILKIISSILLLLFLAVGCKTVEKSVISDKKENISMSKDSILSVFGSISDNIELLNDIQHQKGEIIIKNDTILFNIILRENSVLNKINKIDSIKYINSNIIRDTIYINNNYNENTTKENNNFFKNFGNRAFMSMLFIIIILIIYILYKRSK